MPQGTLAPPVSDREKPPELPVPSSPYRPPPSAGGLFTRENSPVPQTDSKLLRVPTAPAFRDPLSLARALQPLMQQRLLAGGLQLDEPATVYKIAEERVWWPVTKPVTETWLELALVVDESPSMLIWRRTIKELNQFFKHYGFFRDVHLWGLIEKTALNKRSSSASTTRPAAKEGNLDAEAPEGQTEICLRANPFSRFHTQDLQRPESLIDPNGRRLILIVTDCVDPLWQTSQLLSTLKLWSDKGPTTILQMMPEWLWSRTNLRQATPVNFQSPTAGSANQALDVVLASTTYYRRSKAEKKADIKIPIITLESDRVYLWTRMLTAQGAHHAPGAIFNPRAQRMTVAVQQRQQQKTPSSSTGAFKAQTFRGGASPVARRLASLLAASPTITLPIVRMVQETLLPQSKEIHVAEVLLGGILHPKQLPSLETHPDDVQYQFVDSEIRATLLAEAPVSDTTAVFSRYIEERFNKSLYDFIVELRQLIRSERGSEDELKPIATIAAEVLQYRGSEYADFVREVNERFGKSSGPEGGQQQLHDLPELEPFDFIDAQLVNKLSRNSLPKIPSATLLITIDELTGQSDRYYADGWLVPNPQTYNPSTGVGSVALSILGIGRYIDISNDLQLSRGITVQDIPSAIATFLDQASGSSPKRTFSIHIFLPLSLLNIPIEQIGIPPQSRRRTRLAIGPRCHHVVIRSMSRLQFTRGAARWRSKWNQLQASYQNAAKEVFVSGTGDAAQTYRVLEQALGLKLMNNTFARSTPTEELEVFLATGAPIAIWSRGTEQAEDWDRFIDDHILNGTIEEIPARVLALRRAVVPGRDQSLELRSQMAFLWDDPMLVPPRPGLNPPPLQDESAFPPPLETEEFTIITFDDGDSESESFEFTIATMHHDGNRWEIIRQQQRVYRLIEPLPGDLPLEMVAIPDGTFLMGSPEDELERDRSSESPQHEVSIKWFLMGRYPVTQAQWRAVASLPQIGRQLQRNPSRFKGDNRPVEQVTWDDAVEFCARLSVHSGRQYRLPTEAEWEYACRAGTTTPFHFGETITSELANYKGSTTYDDGPQGEFRRETTPVDHFGIANAFALTDMHGNVWEWCQDHWHDNYNGAPIDGSAWIEGGNLSRRVLRGGSWDNEPWYCRSAYRDGDGPDFDDDPLGFRVVCSALRT
ncbi:SAV_2336 N-terminal domain-related protein [Leptolyngbya sp. FACHB-60]|uniref:SAV_2336 N-terminal domain-related protein n=1 Tax=unclassified Leptolyngbya TaxID=2650499 RepID=UPI00321FF9A8